MMNGFNRLDDERKEIICSTAIFLFGFCNLFFYYYWKKNNIQILSKMGFLFFPSDGNYYYTHTQKIHRLFMMIVLLAVESLLEISPRSEGKFLFIQDESRSTFVFFRWEKKRKTIGRFFCWIQPFIAVYLSLFPFFSTEKAAEHHQVVFFPLVRLEKSRMRNVFWGVCLVSTNSPFSLHHHLCARKRLRL